MICIHNFNISILFEHHTWKHFNLFILCACLFPRYVTRINISLNPKSSLPCKVTSTSLSFTCILLFQCILIPPCESSYSSWNINTSTSLPSNIMLNTKQQHVTTLQRKRIWRLLLNIKILKVVFWITTSSTTFFSLKRCLL